MATVYSKAQLQVISGQLATAYREGEKAILQRIVEANLTDYQRARAVQQLELIRQHLDELGEYTTEWAQLHLPGMYAAGMNVADDSLARVPGVLPLPAEFGALHTESIKALGENLSMRMSDVLTVVGRRTDDVFRQAGLNALQEATILGETRRKATKRLVQDLLDKGITGFTDKAGREWALGNYAEMVARTTSREATNQGTFNRLAERGQDLVQISTHGGACELCEPWEGVILSMSGESDKYDALADAEAAGLFHPNCGHVPMPYSEKYAEIR